MAGWAAALGVAAAGERSVRLTLSLCAPAAAARPAAPHPQAPAQLADALAEPAARQRAASLAHALDCEARLLRAEAEAQQRGWPRRWYTARPAVQEWAGLDNQGATCYLNSLLQSLFVCPEVRAHVYNFDFCHETHGAAELCVPLQLARLFCRMQQSQRHIISTRELTSSFGWTEAEAQRQHDVQELCRVLFDTLGKFGVPLARKLFEGTLRNELRCTGCGYVSTRREAFSDVQLDIAGFGSLEQALHHFVRRERMEGADAWQCDRCGARSSEKDTRFDHLPRLMMLHLKRFVFDRVAMRRRKLNHRLSFPQSLDMAPYMTRGALGRSQPYAANLPPLPDDKGDVYGGDCEDCNGEDGEDEKGGGDCERFSGGGSTEGDGDDGEWRYECVGVLVHAGTAHGGHNLALLRPTPGGEWFEFNDSTVRHATAEALLAAEGDDLSSSDSTNESGSSCYMLLYRRYDNHAPAQPNPPASLLREVREEEREAAKLRSWCQAAEKVVRLRVLPSHEPMAAVEMCAHCESTLDALLDRIVQPPAMLLPQHLRALHRPQLQLRLRLWDEARAAPLMPPSLPPQCTLRELGLAPAATLLLEARGSDVGWPPPHCDDLYVRVRLWNRRSPTQTPEVTKPLTEATACVGSTFPVRTSVLATGVDAVISSEIAVAVAVAVEREGVEREAAVLERLQAMLGEDVAPAYLSALLRSAEGNIKAALSSHFEAHSGVAIAPADSQSPLQDALLARPAQPIGLTARGDAVQSITGSDALFSDSLCPSGPPVAVAAEATPLPILPPLAAPPLAELTAMATADQIDTAITSLPMPTHLPPAPSDTASVTALVEHGQPVVVLLSGQALEPAPQSLSTLEADVAEQRGQLDAAELEMMGGEATETRMAAAEADAAAIEQLRVILGEDVAETYLSSLLRSAEGDVETALTIHFEVHNGEAVEPLDGDTAVAEGQPIVQGALMAQAASAHAVAITYFEHGEAVSGAALELGEAGAGALVGVAEAEPRGAVAAVAVGEAASVASAARVSDGSALSGNVVAMGELAVGAELSVGMAAADMTPVAVGAAQSRDMDDVGAIWDGDAKTIGPDGGEEEGDVGTERFMCVPEGLAPSARLAQLREAIFSEFGVEAPLQRILRTQADPCGCSGLLSATAGKDSWPLTSLLGPNAELLLERAASESSSSALARWWSQGRLQLVHNRLGSVQMTCTVMASKRETIEVLKERIARTLPAPSSTFRLRRAAHGAHLRDESSMLIGQYGLRDGDCVFVEHGPALRTGELLVRCFLAEVEEVEGATQTISSSFRGVVKAESVATRVFPELCCELAMPGTASVGDLKSRLLAIMSTRHPAPLTRSMLRLLRRRGARSGTVLRDSMRLHHSLPDGGSEDKEVAVQILTGEETLCDDSVLLQCRLLDAAAQVVPAAWLCLDNSCCTCLELAQVLAGVSAIPLERLSISHPQHGNHALWSLKALTWEPASSLSSSLVRERFAFRDRDVILLRDTLCPPPAVVACEEDHTPLHGLPRSDGGRSEATDASVSMIGRTCDGLEVGVRIHTVFDVDETVVL